MPTMRTETSRAARDGSRLSSCTRPSWPTRRQGWKTTLTCCPPSSGSARRHRGRPRARRGGWRTTRRPGRPRRRAAASSRRSRHARWPDPSGSAPACRRAASSASGPSRRRTRPRSRRCLRVVSSRRPCRAQPSGRYRRSSDRLGDCVGQQPGELLDARGQRGAVRLHPDRVDDGVRTATAGGFADCLRDSPVLVDLVEVDRLVPPAATRARRSVTRSTERTLCPLRSPIRADMSPIGPAPSTSSVPPSETSAYFSACQAVGSTSERNRNRSRTDPAGPSSA